MPTQRGRVRLRRGHSALQYAGSKVSRARWRRGRAAAVGPERRRGAECPGGAGYFRVWNSSAVGKSTRTGWGNDVKDYAKILFVEHRREVSGNFDIDWQSRVTACNCPVIIKNIPT